MFQSRTGATPVRAGATGAGAAAGGRRRGGRDGDAVRLGVGHLLWPAHVPVADRGDDGQVGGDGGGRYVEADLVVALAGGAGGDGGGRQIGGGLGGGVGGR